MYVDALDVFKFKIDADDTNLKRENSSKSKYYRKMRRIYMYYCWL